MNIHTYIAYILKFISICMYTHQLTSTSIIPTNMFMCIYFYEYAYIQLYILRSIYICIHKISKYILYGHINSHQLLSSQLISPHLSPHRTSPYNPDLLRMSPYNPDLLRMSPYNPDLLFFQPYNNNDYYEDNNDESNVLT
jgi:hypothetical protein